MPDEDSCEFYHNSAGTFMFGMLYMITLEIPPSIDVFKRYLKAFLFAQY